MLTLVLAKMDAASVIGIYTIDGVKNRMPERALYLHPSAASHFLTISPWAVVSDMFRTPESSLDAIQRGRGALPPGFSLHNYGIAIDLDVDDSRKNLAKVVGRSVTKADLDDAMESVGYFCHRRDHLEGKSKEHPNDESWHYNHLGIGTEIEPRFKTTAGYAEALIQSMYGAELKPGEFECQVLLKKLRLYSGKIDGDIGPISKSAIRVFKRGWGLGDNSKLDDRTRRTLAYVACERSIQAIAATDQIPLPGV